MLVISPFCESDYEAVTELHQWISELDNNLSGHELLLLAAPGILDMQVMKLSNICRSFSKVSAIRQSGLDPKSWPKGPNRMFQTAMDWVRKDNKAFLWLESDMIPMVPGWLNILESDYKNRGIPFYGAIHDNPFRHLNGGAIYPANIGAFNPYMMGASELPFDCVRPELTLKHGYNSPLMQRLLADPSKNLAMDFPDRASLSAIRPGVILFHGCKNTSLIQRLREQRQHAQPNGFKTIFKAGLRKVFGGRTQKETIVVRRTGAIGDALAATCVATKLVEQGFKVTFQCHKTVQPVLRCVPGITVTDVGGECDVNLDGCYETDPNRNTKHFADIFIGSANAQLSKRKVSLKALNIAPTLKVKEKECQKLMGWIDLPRPWIGIVPKSNSFKVRTVPDEAWAMAAEYIQGTVFWLGTDPAPSGRISDLKFRDIKKVMLAISQMDLVVSVDTGPAHIAIALGIPTIVIEQASSPDFHFSDQRDWLKVAPDNLSCLNCNQAVCPIDEESPPCQFIDPTQIATAVNRKLRQVQINEDISAVIPVYRPSSVMLNKCLVAALPQVSEIIVCRDQAGVFPTGAMKHPKIKYVTTWRHDVGYGRKLNVAVRHSSCKYLHILNDDCFLDPDADKKLMDIMLQNPKVGAVGHLLWRPGRRSIQHGGTQRNPENPADLGWGHIDDHKSTPSITKPCQMENVTWASALVRRAAFYEAGGFDERQYLYWDENMVNMRMRRKGWEVWYTPHAEAIHDEHASTKTTPKVDEHVKHSREIFASEWQDFFIHNKDRVPGNFEYLDK